MSVLKCVNCGWAMPSIEDALRAELKRYVQAIDRIYGHSDSAQEAVLKHFGTCHSPLARSTTLITDQPELELRQPVQPPLPKVHACDAMKRDEMWVGPHGFKTCNFCGKDLSKEAP